jgi:hypothetical protein
MQGVVGSNVYQSSDAPRYLPGHGICMGFLAVFLFGGAIVHRTLLARENKARASGKRDHLLQGMSESEIAVMGDKRSVIPCSYLC